jgi:hypothetical protein
VSEWRLTTPLGEGVVHEELLLELADELLLLPDQLLGVENLGSTRRCLRYTICLAGH